MAKLRDEWGTPDWLYGWLNSIFGFVVDLAATAENAKHPCFMGPESDSLTRIWRMHKGPGFLNPPYSNIAPWVEKAAKEAVKGFTSVMVLPTPNGERYWKHVFDHAAHIIYIHGRVNFTPPDESIKQSSNPRGTCVVVFQPKSPLLQENQTVPAISHIERSKCQAIAAGEQLQGESAC